MKQNDKNASVEGDRKPLGERCLPERAAINTPTLHNIAIDLLSFYILFIFQQLTLVKQLDVDSFEIYEVF
jgi:hypothetical protein